MCVRRRATRASCARSAAEDVARRSGTCVQRASVPASCAPTRERTTPRTARGDATATNGASGTSPRNAPLVVHFVMYEDTTLQTAPTGASVPLSSFRTIPPIARCPPARCATSHTMRTSARSHAPSALGTGPTATRTARYDAFCARIVLTSTTSVLSDA